MKISNAIHFSLSAPPADPERQALEMEFLSVLTRGRATAVGALKPIVLRLCGIIGATRKELLALALSHGHQKAYIRSLLSEILVSSGRRQRKSGAGPKTPRLAQIILAFARAIAGRQAEKMLRAAAHVARVEDEATLLDEQNQIMAGCAPTPVGLPLLSGEALLQARPGFSPLILSKISPHVPALETQPPYPDRG